MSIPLYTFSSKFSRTFCEYCRKSGDRLPSYLIYNYSLKLLLKKSESAPKDKESIFEIEGWENVSKSEAVRNGLKEIPDGRRINEIKSKKR